MDILNLKRRALNERQDLDRLVGVYEDFQAYIERLARLFNDEAAGPELISAQESLRLQLRDEEHRFLEWQDGQQVLNHAIFSIVEEPETYLRNLQRFQVDLFLATKKFEHMIRKKRRLLQDLHEEIALLTSEAEARSITTIDATPSTSTVEKVKKADEVAEIGLKWGQRLVKFSSWAETIIRLVGLR